MAGVGVLPVFQEFSVLGGGLSLFSLLFINSAEPVMIQRMDEITTWLFGSIVVSRTYSAIALSRSPIFSTPGQDVL